MSIVTREFPGCRDLLALAAANPRRYPCLLQSIARGGSNARFDILFAFPQSKILLDQHHRLHNDCSTSRELKFLSALDEAWHAEHQACTMDQLPFHGGWVLYLGYELAAEIEPTLKLPGRPQSPMPVAMALRCPAAVIIDHERHCTVVMAECGYEECLLAMSDDLASANVLTNRSLSVCGFEEDAAQTYLDGIDRIHEYLQAGDVFQVNLSREWRVGVDQMVSAGALYASLREANPAPFSGLLQWEDWAIASSSPERLIKVREGIVETRPIAGTRPRVHGEDDQSNILALGSNPKERAEHVMLIDLARNDLGRVCVSGTVAVDELMTVESYAHVHHIVSNVRGRLHAHTTPGQIIAAVFPGGTITGCPKVRCMEIIAELEGVGRGPYTGALGYLDRDGSLDLNILIRTLQWENGGIRLRAGAGIVADSQPQRELEETRAKARGLLRALGIAG